MIPGRSPVVLENFAATAEKVIAKTAVKHIVVCAMGDLMGIFKGTLIDIVVRHVKKMVPEFELPGAVRFTRLIAESLDMTLKPVKLGQDDIAFLQYTGGTTGVSKGAILLHRNVIANVLQSETWVTPELSRPPVPEQLIIVCALPLYHILP